VPGSWGIIAAGLFDEGEGIFHNGSGSLLGIQCLGLLCTVGWGIFFGIMVFGSLRAAGVLRVDYTVEAVGLMNTRVGYEGFELKDDIDLGLYACQIKLVSEEDSEDED
jgi:ammonia channel protein AmtB